MPLLIRSLSLICFILWFGTPLRGDDSLRTSPVPEDDPSKLSPLQPLDCTSPFNTMKSYMDSANAIANYLNGEHWHNPSKETVEEINIRIKAMMRLMDTSSFPPAVRHKQGIESLFHLVDVIRRIDPAILLTAPASEPGKELPENWTVPNTEITITKMTEGEREGDYVFSSETTQRSIEFYELIKDSPVFGECDAWLGKREYLTPAGWMISSSTIENFPAWLKQSYFGQGLWKIFVLGIFIGCWTALIFFTVRGCRGKTGESALAKNLRKIGMPLLMIFISWNVRAILFQLTFSGEFATGLAFTAAVLLYVGLALLSIPLVMLFVELVIRSPHIAADCLDAHLLRLGGRTVGLGIAITFLFMLSEQIGFPLYGLVAGVGVGGLAVALAARQSLENYLAGINLLSDRPVAIGDWCRYPEAGTMNFGEVLSVGMRSTRIRNYDNTVTSIPNSKFATMMITNLSARDGTYLFRKNLRLRLDSPTERVNEVLKLIRNYLIDLEQVIDEDPGVNLDNIGPDAINIRVSCKLDSDIEGNQWQRFLDLQEEILLGISAVVEKCGLEFAYPTTIVKKVPGSAQPEQPFTNAAHT
ncbi:MAG: hypothetical protein CBC35_03405 [Planctomycetes bacterium TMED75]|nr:hypothetical protein [Planctomycetaceae bacterium]OUU94761.1 MAG: hypothetical protein CBC35_03405 [Planctomycetes bacterium TMED75]